MPGEHELQIALATALREANSLHVRLRSETARADRCAMDLAETLDALSKSTDRTIAAQKECDAARAEAQRLQEALAAARRECEGLRVALRACLESFGLAHAHKKLAKAADGGIVCACDLARAALAGSAGRTDG